MGAAASAIPDTVDKETFLKLGENKFHPKLFDKYSDDGVLTKEKLLYLIHQSDVFLSYHDGKDQSGRDIPPHVLKIAEALKAKQLVVNLSVEQTADLRDKAIAAIENTRTVVVFLSQSYITKVSGRFGRSRSKVEFGLAVRRKGASQIIPVIIEDACADHNTWKGPIGTAFQGQMPVDYRQDNQVDVIAQQLYDMITKVTVPLLSEHATFTIPQPTSSSTLLASPTKPLRCPEDFHHHYDTSDGKIICLQCDNPVKAHAKHAWGNGWSCDWPTHEGINTFHSSDVLYGCDTFHDCNFALCKTCHDRITTGQDTFTTESPTHCIHCKQALFAYPISFGEELGGQWSCESNQHRGSNLFSAEDQCYACSTPGDCAYIICEQCFRRGAMSATIATALDEREEDGGIVLHRGGAIDDDEEPIFD